MAQLTVGIPVYNAMPFLVECIDGIRAQTCGDFELLIINDGSTDGSLEFLNALRDPRLRVIHQKNRGLTATLNRMLAEVRTPWLMRLDADDVAYPNRVQRTLESIERYPDSGMFCSLANYYPQGCYGQFRATRGTPEQFRELVQSGYLPAICHPTVTLNAERAINAGGYRFNLYIEDIDLWWRMALQYDIRLIPEVTLGFRQNLKSVSSANLAKQALNTLYVQYLLLSHLWQLTPLPYEEACQPLSQLLSPSKLQCKAHLREFNIELGRGHRGAAVAELAAALASSPTAFARRLWDEFSRPRNISLGEPPQIFARHRQNLWPNVSSTAAACKPADESPATPLAVL